MTRDEIVAFRERMARYNEWERAHPVRLTPQEALRAIDEAYALLPQAARQRVDDPRYNGVRRMWERLRRA